MFGNYGLGGLLKEGAHEKSPKCLGGNLGDFGGISQRSQINEKSDLGKEDKVLHHLQRLLQAGLADSWTKPILRLISNSRYPVFHSGFYLKNT